MCSSDLMTTNDQIKIVPALSSGLGKGDVKIFMSPETLKVQKETLPTEEGLFLVFY